MNFKKKVPCFKIKKGEISFRGCVRENKVGTISKVLNWENVEFALDVAEENLSMNSPKLVSQMEEI